jgi:GTP pyrophosphokinase
MKYENVSAKKLLQSIKKGFESEVPTKTIKLAEDNLNERELKNALNCAYILSSLGLKRNSIAAALLCETKIKEEEIQKEFGEEIKSLVASIRKIKKIESQNRNFAAETLSKIILAATKDIRTIIMILSSKLCELRNAGKEDKELAKKVIEVYLPITQKLGLDEIRWELEDLSFKILNSKEYHKIKNLVRKKRKERENDLKKIVNEIKKELKKQKIQATVIGRVKNFYGIYRKMKRKNCKINEVHDLIAVRIICNTIKECYIILGIVHSMYEPLLNSFDDYIANPKENNYRSIHTDLKTKEGKIFEAQIRTWEMNAEAEEGLPAHWAYKEIKKDKEFDGKLTWAKELIEWNRRHSSKKISNAIKIGFEDKKMFVLTPNSDIIELVPKATPIDFAYAIHSSLGNKCLKAKVNGKMVPLDYELENGDVVEIITSEKQQPKRQWLSTVKTAKAKAKIRQFLKITKEKKGQEIKESIPEKTIRAIRISKCCNPIPGDKIFAIKTTKRKLTVHRENCENLKRENPKKIIPLNWEMIGRKELSTKIKINAREKINLLTEILDVIASFKAKAVSIQVKVENKNFSCKFILQTKKPQTIGKIIEKIRQIDGITEVRRE